MVSNSIPIPLLGEEELAVGGEGLVEGVAGDEGVEVGLDAVLLGAENAAEALPLTTLQALRATLLCCFSNPLVSSPVSQLPGQLARKRDDQRALALPTANVTASGG